MKTNKNLLYIVIAMLTAVSMVLAMAACGADTANEEDGGNRDRTTSEEGEGTPTPTELDNLSYEQAERKLIEDGAGEYSKLAGVFKEANDNASGEMTLTLTPQEYILDILGVDEKVSDTVFEIRSATQGKDAYAGFTYKSGKKEIISADFWLNGNDLILNLPLFFDKYLSMDLEGMLDNMGIDSESITDAMDSEFPELPSEKAIKEILNVAIDEYFSLVGSSITVDEGVELDINGTKVSADKNTIEMTDEIVFEIILSMLKAVNDNNEIMSFIDELAVQLGGDTDAEEIMEEAIKSIEDEIDFADGDAFTMTCYVYGSQIVKRVIEDDEAEITLITFESGNNYFVELDMDIDGEKIKMTESGKKDGNSLTGESEMDFRIHGEKFNVKIEYENLTINDKFEITDGTINISSNDVAGYKASLKLEFGKSSFKGSLVISGVKAATVELKWNDSFKAPPAPSISSSNSIDLEELGDDAMVMFMTAFATGFMQITTSYEDNYDLIGYFILNQFEELLGAMV
jgi:hypothetical protein